MKRSDIPDGKYLVLRHKGTLVADGLYDAQKNEVVFTFRCGKRTAVSAENLTGINPEFDGACSSVGYTVELDPSFDIDSILGAPEAAWAREDAPSASKWTDGKRFTLLHKGKIAGTGVYHAEMDEAVVTLSCGQLLVVSANDLHSTDEEFDKQYPNLSFAVELDPSVDLDSVLDAVEDKRRWEERNPLAKQIGGTHYKECEIQPVQFIEANSLGFLEGCVIKRLTRHNKPSGKGRQDIEKAIHELQLLLNLRYKEDDDDDDDDEGGYDE